MKYIVRSLKYFLYISCIMALIITVLALCGVISKDIDKIFVNGWNSVAMIEGLFFAVACIYPRIGYQKRAAQVPGEYAQLRKGVIAFMEEKGYALEKEEGENLYFRSRSVVNRIFRVWEDRISLERCLGGWTVEGLGRDIARIVSGLEYRFREEQ